MSVEILSMNAMYYHMFSKLILDGIFGRQVGDVFEEGLVDSLDSGDFKRKFESLFAKWSDMECMSSTDMDGFLQWFKANKTDVICNTMLRSVRVQCGIGTPPDISQQILMKVSMPY